ncbi:MAG: sigma-54 dependent transcriptional regulator [Mariprofundaceae bacterium]
MSGRIMIVDDEQAIRDSLRGLFEDGGYQVVCAASGEEALARLRKQGVDCVLLDIWMPGIDGLETLDRIRRMDDRLPVIMMSGHGTIDTAVRATRQGAFDFLEKPLSSDRLLILARNAVSRYRLERENVELRRSGNGEASRRELIGQGRAIEAVRALIRKVAQADAPVLILGEHGTGKAVAARMLHAASRRKDGPFVEVNTAGVPEGRMDSELFGHEKGAFPGALHAQRGKLELAHRGTLFLDEITELDPGAQAKLLAAMQRRRIQRLGLPEPIEADVRIVAASSRDLERALAEERLREDFFYRLNVVSIRMPPLRERLEDLPLLVETLAREQAARLGGEPVRFTADAMARLAAYRWPGNVRELRNYIERCHILMPGEELDASRMPPPELGAHPGGAAAAGVFRMPDGVHRFQEAREAFERAFLREHLERHDWNISRTAADIGVERRQLHRKIKALGLSPPEREEGS